MRLWSRILRVRTLEATGGVAVVFVCMLGILSWHTTEVHYLGWLGAGEYRVRVIDDREQAVAGGSVTVSVGGETPSRLLFENYTGPNSIVTDGSGEFSLVVPRPLPTGGRERYLFWIWRVGTVPFTESIKVEVRAPGYINGVASTRDVLDRTSVATVVLRSREEPRKQR